METVTAVLSKIGGRSNNQDYCGHLETNLSSIWIAADGMGGHLGGEMASYLAVNTILEQFSTTTKDVNEENLNSLLTIANKKVRSTQKEMLQYESMQTTIAIALANDEQTILANIGDARAYYFSQCEIIKRTIDHSLPQILAKQGEISECEIRHHEDRNKVLKSIGKEDEIVPSFYVVSKPPEKGDALLLCTDGFWELVYETEMEVDLAKSITPENWLRKMELRLLKRMSTNHDNYSAIAVLFQ